jgi:hypothetical protein
VTTEREKQRRWQRLSPDAYGCVDAVETARVVEEDAMRTADRISPRNERRMAELLGLAHEARAEWAYALFYLMRWLEEPDASTNHEEGLR